jgi:dolichyl-phosphate beta-glucosyltransferase
MTAAEGTDIRKGTGGPRRGPLLSIVVPAYNEERRLPESLRKIADFVESRDYPVEVIVVDSRSTDRTASVIREAAAKHAFIRYIFEQKAGKGAALRTGILAAEGEYFLISDADLAVPIEEASRFLPLLENFAIAIGSREVEGARRHGEPFQRHLMGRVFNLMVRLLVLPGILDTQCGFKAFRRGPGRELFSASTIDGWSFDVEVLYMARLLGFRMIEVPVNWYYGEHSKVNPALDTWNMFREVLKIWRNAQKGMYRRR